MSSLPLPFRTLFASLALFLASTATSREAETLHLQGRHLHTAAGEKLVLRGVNEMIVWSDDPRGEVIYPEIAKSRANVVRIVWTTEGDFSDLAASVSNCLIHGMIPMLELHDATGNIEKVPALVDFWLRPEMLAIIETHKKWFILNIANEAGAFDTPPERFVEIYTDALAKLRGAGIEVPIVIDSTDWGKDETMILKTWRKLQAADPLKNVLFSVHTYWVKNQQARLDALVNTVVKEQIPFLFGEGPQQVGYDCETEFPWQNLLAQCQEAEIGWIAWSWGYNDNGDCHPGKFDMTRDGTFGNWENDWGRGLVLEDPNSIFNTSIRPASLLAEQR